MGLKQLDNISEKTWLHPFLVLLPGLYYYLASFALGRDPYLQLAHITSIAGTLAGSIAVIYAMKFYSEERMQVSFAASILMLALLPVIYPVLGLKLGGKGWLFILLAAVSVSLGSIEWLVREGRNRINLSDPSIRKATGIGLIYTLISFSMFFISRAQYSPLDFIGFSKGAITLLIIAGIVFTLNFLAGALPAYLALEKELYLPITTLLLWLAAGLITFQQISGGLVEYGAWPPQPDYALKPVTPLALTIIAAKLEESFKKSSE